MSGAIVQTRSHPDLGTVLVDSDGMTLYMFENDPRGEGKSVCSGSCADAWPPLTVDSANTVSKTDAITAKLGTIERSDGSTQVTAAGWPLYYFASDKQPGDVKGQGVNNVWWVLHPDGSVIEPNVQTRSHSEYGEILTDSDGMTLYMFDQDTQGEKKSACYDGCASAWPPFIVKETATKASSVSADVATFERESGKMQAIAGGWPLYYFNSDMQPGDAKGQGVNNVWWVLRPDGTPMTPNTTTTTASNSNY